MPLMLKAGACKGKLYKGKAGLYIQSVKKELRDKGFEKEGKRKKKEKKDKEEKN